MSSPLKFGNNLTKLLMKYNCKRRNFFLNVTKLWQEGENGRSEEETGQSCHYDWASLFVWGLLGLCLLYSLLFIIQVLKKDSS